MKVPAKYIDPHGNKKKNSVKYPYPTGFKKNESLIIRTQKKNNTRPTLVTNPNLGETKGKVLDFSQTTAI